MPLAGAAPLNIRKDPWAPEDLYDERDVTRSEAPGRVGQVRWSWSTLSALMVCPRKFELSVLHQIAPVPPAQPLTFGIAVHTAMEVFWRRILWEDNLGGIGWRAAHLDAVVRLAAEDAVGILDGDTRLPSVDKPAAIRVIKNFAYETAYSQVGKWAPVWVEGVLDVDLATWFSNGRAPLRDDDLILLRRTLPTELFGRPPWPDHEPLIPWECRPDLIVRELDGSDHPGIWVVDHKTATAVRPTELRSYTQDGQVLGNVLGARLGVFPDAAGFCLNLLGKDAKPNFFHGYLSPMADLLGEFVLEVARWQRLYRGYLGAARWPRSFARGACMHQYGPCDFFNPCSEGRGAILAAGGSYPGLARRGEQFTAPIEAIDDAWKRWFELKPTDDENDEEMEVPWT